MRDVIEELKQRNYRHFDDFYHATKKAVFYTVITIIKDQNLVEDIMQDTYMKFLEHIDEVDSRGHVKAYLTRIARNLAINMYNKRKKEIIDDTQFDYMIVDAQQTEDLDVFNLLNILDANEREIVVMHVINDLKFREIASIIEKPLGTVLWMYNKAMKKLKAKAGDDHETQTID